MVMGEIKEAREASEWRKNDQRAYKKDSDRR